MELICPAADVSAQISTAGKEASGTGNMKLMMNGALTVGTLDGANVEIRDAVGAENFFLFGLTVEGIEALQPHYDPAAMISSDPELAAVFARLDDGAFDGGEPGVLNGVVGAMRHASDPWMTVADAAAYFAAQRAAAETFRNVDRFTRMSILNTAASGRFSSDRTIQAYNDDIWRLTPLAP
jgi:starch phosphorylase